MSKIRLDFWHKDWFSKTALGRTLSGKNKAGQILSIIKDTALSYMPLIGKPLAQITGKIVSRDDAAKIGKELEELNLGPKTRLVIKIIVAAALGYLFVAKILSSDQLNQLIALFHTAGIL